MAATPSIALPPDEALVASNLRHLAAFLDVERHPVRLLAQSLAEAGYRVVGVRARGDLTLRLLPIETPGMAPAAALPLPPIERLMCLYCGDIGLPATTGLHACASCGRSTEVGGRPRQ